MELRQWAHRLYGCGSVVNAGAVVDFLEFEGKGLPGFSGGPVFNQEGKVVAIMREAWTKRGVKGGPAVLLNRAFSVQILSDLDQEVYSPSMPADKGRQTLLGVCLENPDPRIE